MEVNSQRSHLCIECLLFAENTEAVGSEVLVAFDTTDEVPSPGITDTLGGMETGNTGAVGGAGLALAAWWQAARWRFFSLSPGPR